MIVNPLAVMHQSVSDDLTATKETILDASPHRDEAARLLRFANIARGHRLRFGSLRCPLTPRTRHCDTSISVKKI